MKVIISLLALGRIEQSWLLDATGAGAGQALSTRPREAGREARPSGPGPGGIDILTFAILKNAHRHSLAGRVALSIHTNITMIESCLGSFYSRRAYLGC